MSNKSIGYEKGLKLVPKIQTTKLDSKFKSVMFVGKSE